MHKPNRHCFVFAGGGTGGHLFPGIAVAQELTARYPQARILFTGSDRGVEKSIVAHARFEHHASNVVPSTSIARRPLRGLASHWSAFRAARRLLDQQSPQCVIGLGGFASVPVVLAARTTGVPIVLLEQNLVPGRATRWLSGRADRVCISFADTARLLSPRTDCILTGNPVRRAIAEMNPGNRNSQRETSRPVLLVLGGSQGAQSVNRAMLTVAERLRKHLADWKIVHQTGRDQEQLITGCYRQLRLDAVVSSFFDDLLPWYTRSRLTVSRAGATTLAELACAACPSILVPYPNSVGDHQLRNAEFYEHAGAARVVEESRTPETTNRRLVDAVADLLENPQSRTQMSASIKHLARHHAAEQVADVILTAAGHESSPRRSTAPRRAA